MKIRSVFPALVLAVWTLAFAAFAATPVDVTSAFGLANKLYSEGHYAGAADNYQQVIRQMIADGRISPTVYFNYGNAEFKLGHLGMAIAAYHRAALLSPRDSEVVGNLEFVRNQVQGATVRPVFWQNWVGFLTLNEGTCLTAGLFWVTLVLYSVRQIRPALAPKLRGLALTSMVATVLAGAVLALQAANHFNGLTAVVTDANAIARSGPFTEAQNVFAVHDGAELKVLDRHDNWLQVTDGTGKIGWLSQGQLELLPGA